VKRTLLIATALMTWALSPSAAQDDSPVLHSLPAEVQKNIEDTRAACRAYLNDRGIADASDFLLSSGDVGLISFALSGAQAVMVSNLKLCGGQCLDKVNCDNRGGSEIIIYVRAGSTWKTAYEDSPIGDVFLSLDWSRDPPAFRAMVLNIQAASKECPKRYRDRLIRIRGFKWPCDVIVRWNGAKFTYDALSRE
jgi:hypothetical protein